MIFYILIERNDSQAKLDVPVSYSLHDELKKILYVNKKERIHACADQPKFQFVFSCFHNYEVCTVVCLSVCLFVCLHWALMNTSFNMAFK